MSRHGEQEPDERRKGQFVVRIRVGGEAHRSDPEDQVRFAATKNHANYSPWLWPRCMTRGRRLPRLQRE